MYPTQPALKRAYADTPTGQVHYYDAGGDGLPLLMLHQSPTSSLDYVATFPFLAEAGIRVIAMDNPGMGMSDAPKTEPTIADYADVTPFVLDHAGVSVVDVIGHHTGAQIAVEAAFRHQSRFRKIVLYGAPVMTPAEQQDYWTRTVPRERLGAVHQPVSGAANLVEQFERYEKFAGVATAQRFLLTNLMAGPLWWYGHNAALTHDMAPALIAAPQPVLMLSHLSEMLHQNTLAARQLKPDATLQLLDTTGAVAMDSDPAGFVRAVAEFLRE